MMYLRFIMIICIRFIATWKYNTAFSYALEEGGETGQRHEHLMHFYRFKYLLWLTLIKQYFCYTSIDGFIQLTSLSSNNTGVIPNKGTVMFTCSSTVVGNVGTLNSRWKLNSLDIDPRISSKWTLINDDVNANDPTTRTFRLLVNPIMTVDSGNIYIATGTVTVCGVICTNALGRLIPDFVLHLLYNTKQIVTNVRT